MSGAGAVLVIAAPSGAGKTSLARAVVERRDKAVFALSATTRPPRPGETHGEDYWFVNDAGFDALEREGRLLEFANVHGRRYGTLKDGVERALADGRTVVLDIDVQGARRVRSAVPGATLLFVLPPSAAEMLRRLQKRGSEGPAERATRLRTARAELDAVQEFDHVVVNEVFEDAVQEIEAVLDGNDVASPQDAEITALLEQLRSDIDRIIQEG